MGWRWIVASVSAQATTIVMRVKNAMKGLVSVLTLASLTAAVLLQMSVHQTFPVTLVLRITAVTT